MYRWTRRRARIALLVTICALGVAGCGSGGKDQSAAVRETVVRFGKATAARDYAAICGGLLSRDLLSKLESIGLPCERALEVGLGRVKAPRLTVGRVKVRGDTALAQVTSSAGGQAPSLDTIGLIKESGRWRISRLANVTGPPSPPKVQEIP